VSHAPWYASRTLSHTVIFFGRVPSLAVPYKILDFSHDGEQIDGEREGACHTRPGTPLEPFHIP
jgi:hypothetical protein